MLDKIFRFVLRLIQVRTTYRAVRKNRLPQHLANKAIWRVNRRLVRRILFK